MRPQDRGYDQHPRTRGFVKVRPEKVARGKALAIAIRASGRLPAMSDEAEELLLRDLAAADHVNEADVALATAHGTKRGERKQVTKRQAEILQMYADGLHPQEMMAKTGTSRANIRNRLEAAKYCLDAKTTYEAVAKAVEAGLVRGAPLPIYAAAFKEGSRRRSAKPQKRSSGDMTPRELEVLTLVAEGCTNTDIADRLGVREDTVKTHMKSVIQRLNANGRAHAVAVAIREGLIQ